MATIYCCRPAFPAEPIRQTPDSAQKMTCSANGEGVNTSNLLAHLYDAMLLLYCP